MTLDTVVLFRCSCGEILNTTFNTKLYNYHTVGCKKCGIIYEVPRPKIQEHTNLSRADEEWLKENGFDKRVEG